MFTRCPQCTTVFRVTANQLRAARGDVRCGNCAHVFNAMESLADELPRRRQQEHADAPEGDDDAMEFDAPEQTWGEIFIEARPKPGDVALDGEIEAITANPEEWRAMLAELGVAPADVEPDLELEDTGIEMGAASLMAEDDEDAAIEGFSSEGVPAAGETEENETPARELDERQREPEPVYVIDTPPPEAANAEAAIDAEAVEVEEIVIEAVQPIFADDAAAPADSLDAAVSATSPDDEFPLWYELDPATTPEHERRPSVIWAVAAVLLAAALMLQLGHQARDSLAAHPRYGELVRNAYASANQRLYPDWSLDSFFIRRSEALAGGSTPEALDISAAVEVTGAQPVGLPLVRVTLRDQWANTVGRRVFVPDEYLATDLPGIVPPGTRIPVALSLADPGTKARGYEVDLCLQRRQTGLECQLAEAPYRP
jgi:predicted Zn finger-like uncharacterized protein